MRNSPVFVAAISALSLLASRGLTADGAAPFTYDGLRSLISSRNIGTVDELIPNLPEDCRKHSVLVYRTRSVQYADSKNPRVILYCNDGKLLLSFNGDPNRLSSNTVEIIRYNDADKSFKFTELTFNQHRPNYEEDPVSCAQCHGEERPHPIWDSYNLWPGVYGSENGQIAVGSAEDQNFRTFLGAHSADPGRYGSLIGLPTLNDLAQRPAGTRYAPVNTSSIESFNALIQKLNFDNIMPIIQGAPSYGKYKYALLAGLANCDGIESFLPRSEVDRFSATYHRSFADILQDTVTAEKTYTLGKFSRQTEAGRAPGEPAFNTPNPSQDSYDPGRHGVNGYSAALDAPVAKLRYLMMAQGISIDEWPLPKDAHSFTFDDGGYSYFQLTARLASDVSSTDPDLAQFFSIRTDTIGNGTTIQYDRSLFSGGTPNPELCTKLKQKSLAAFGAPSGGGAVCANCGSATGNLAAQPLPPGNAASVSAANAAAAAVLQRGRAILQNQCMSCHARGTHGAPKLPLSEALGLRSALLKNNKRLFNRIKDLIASDDPDVQMPPQQGLGEDERKALQDYLKDVMK